MIAFRGRRGIETQSYDCNETVVGSIPTQSNELLFIPLHTQDPKNTEDNGEQSVNTKFPLPTLMYEYVKYNVKLKKIGFNLSPIHSDSSKTQDDGIIQFY